MPAKASAVLCALVAALVALVLAGSAFATGGSGDPSLNLTVDQPASALYGTPIPITLTAANPAGQDYGYNLTFRDVLPAGTSYVAGSSTGNGASVPDPTIVTNPTTGAETLIWSDLGDLSGGSSYPLSFNVTTNNTKYDVDGAAPNTSGSVSTDAQVYVNTDPRYIPKFNADGTPNGPSSTSFTGESALDPATTQLSAITIKKSGPATLLRGVHDHQGVYDLTVTDNAVNPTDSVTVDDWLPADLEFLGCGGTNTDNTTNADGTNPGSPDEYPGSGAVVVPAVSNCITPTSVTTVDTTPPGTDANGNPLPAGVYTHVVWTIGNLTPGQVVTIPYTAAVPIRENTLNWAANTTGTATTTTAPATTGAQGTNLDNNNGSETYNNEPIVNGSEASGFYQDPADANASLPTSDTSVLSGVAKDIIIGKTVSSPSLVPGATPIYTLTVNTSEYRFYNNLTVTDTLPNGQCPLDSTQNFEHQASGQCGPVSGLAPSSEYKSAVEQVGSGGTGDGTYDISWNPSTDAALTQIPVNGTVVIKFPVRTLRYYQKNGADDTATPVLSGDGITNFAGVSGTDSVRCTGGTNAEDCAGGTPISFDATTSNGTTPSTVGTDAAQASQVSTEPSIEKEVAAALPADGSCADATYQTTLATYGPGDEVCWLLVVHFPSATDTRVATLNDFLPDGLTTIAGSETAAPANTVPFTDTESATTPQISFTVCPAGNTSANCGSGSAGDVGPGGQTFAVTFASTEGAPSGHLSGDVNGNLMKFASVDTAGVTDPMRSEADFQFSVPTLGLSKTVAAVGANSEPAGTKSATVTGGATVTYQLAVANSGTVAALNSTVWDELPTGETCANVVASANDTCVAASGSTPAHIVFTGVSVPAKSSTTLSFQVTLPLGASAPSPGQTLTDTAGVTSYQSTDNTGGTENYYPTGDLDPNLSPFADAPAATSTAAVTLTAPGLTKTAVSTVHEVGTADATIGEPILYTVSSTLPADTTLYGTPGITDTVPATLSVNDATVTATLDGSPLPAGATLTANGNAISVTLPAPYEVGASNDTVVISFDATVLDAAANKRAATITNTATLAYSDSVGAAHSKSASAATTIVEPDLQIAKTDNTTGGKVAPGQSVIFTVTASNLSTTDVSPAHDVAVVDTVPSSITVLNTNGQPAVTGDTVSTDGGGGKYNASTNTITWNDIGTLAKGASSALHYTAVVNENPASGQTLTNTVTDTTSSLPAGTTGERTSTSTTNTGYKASAADTLTINGPTIVKTASPTSATIGQTVTYQATATLPANTVFHDLTLLDTLPNGIDFGSYSSVSCSFTCNVSTLNSKAGTVAGSTNVGWFAGEVGPFTTPQTITVTYTGYVASALANGTAVVDTNSLVNTATVQTDQTEKLTGAPTTPPAASSFQNQYGPATAPVTVIEPKLAINKTVVDGSGTPGHTATADPEDTLTYAVTVTNTGDAPAYNVDVSDTPPASLTNVMTSAGISSTDLTQAWTKANPTMKWVVTGPIAVGASVTFTYTAVVPDGVTDGEAIDNTASVPSFTSLPGANVHGRTYTADPTSSDVVTVAAPVLAITKTPASATATAGSGDSYTVTVSNTGHSAAHAVTVTDTVPTGMNYTAGSATAAADAAFSETSDTGGVITWALGNIPAGSNVAISVPVSFPANTPDPTTLTNHATTQAPNAPNAPTAGSPITVHASADLQAIKSVATSPIPAGGQDTYTLSVKNVGPSDAQSVTLTDVLPASETFVSADTGCTDNAGTVTCAAGTVAAGTTKSFHVTVSVSPTVTGTISNTLVVASPTPDPNPANNSVTIAPDSISQADVSVTKTADGIQFNGGDTITYTLTAHNAGPATAEGVVLTDPLSGDVTFASASTGCTAASGTVTCDAGAIPVGASESFTVKVTANGTAPPAATPGTGDEQLAVNKLEQQLSLAPGETTTVQLSCSSGYISDGDAKVIEVDQGTGTLASVEILKSFAVNATTYEFTLDNTATGNAQAQLNALCLPATTTADQNGNTHPLITGAQVTNTETLTQGDHTITVDVGNADVPIAPSFDFLNGDGTVQGSEGSSDSSVWTYTVDVTTPTATVEVGSTPLQTQPGAAGGFTNDLEFTSVSQQVTVGANSTTTASVICPNGYEGIEATYHLPDGLLLLGDDPEPITRVYLLDNTTGAAITGTLDLLCLADRTGPEVDYLGPVLNTATSSEINIDPNTANNAGTAAVRIDRAVGSGAVGTNPVAPAGPTAIATPGAPVTASPIPATPIPAAGTTTSVAPVAKTVIAKVAPALARASVKISATATSITVTCSATGTCEGTATLTIPVVRGGKRVTLTVAAVKYTIAKGKKVKIVLHFKQGDKLTKAQQKHLTLTLKPTGGSAKRFLLKG